VEYFRDETDVIPRGVIPILGAEIKGPLKCTVNGNHECFSISIEPRHKDKVFKLASVKAGSEGIEDTLSWIAALVNGAKPLDAGGQGQGQGQGQGDGVTSFPDLAGYVEGPLLDSALSPRITRPRSSSHPHNAAGSSAGAAGFSNPPPLLTHTHAGTASSRGSTRIRRRSILGSVVAAVQRRGGAGGTAGASWVPAPVSQQSYAHIGATPAPPPGGAGAEAVPPAEEEEDQRWAAGWGLKEGQGLLRAEILAACMVGVLAGGWAGGLYGVVAACVLCMLLLLVAVIPIADE
jgi:hypothetical protein